MKYKHWDEYSDAKRWEVSKKEAALETNNGTTKEDLNNIINFLVQIADPYTTEDLVDEVKKPVTWQEAILAWAEGKTIIVENTCDKRKYDGKKNFLIDEYGNPMGSWEITNGTWYVED